MDGRVPLTHAMRCAGVIVLMLLAARDGLAQGTSWPTKHQQATWMTVTVEHALAERTALLFDANLRRMQLLDEPQQVLVRSGLLFAIDSSVRVGAGYAYAATATYGEVPAPAPLREHRIWQQIVLRHDHGRLALSNRVRWEQRWSAPVVDGALGRFVYSQRARVLMRAETPIRRPAPGARPMIGFAQSELMVAVGHGGSIGRLAQNRIAFGVGLPIAAGQRLDVGYLNLWNPIATRESNEVNHTITFNWVVSSGR